jgi:methylthioribulose-1-phosphate dehydratase
MPHSFDDLDPRSALTEIARDFHRRGWMAGTAGNLSARDQQNPASFWITASGLPKGRLDETNFLRIDLGEERVLERFQEQAKPSAETAIHRVIYQLFPQVNACLHVHSVDACLAVAQCPADRGELPLPALEMIKGLDIWEEHPAVALPLFANLPDVPAIAAQIRQRFTATPPILPALMIHNHGATVWGRSPQEAYNRVEIVEFIMSYLSRSQGVKS